MRNFDVSAEPRGHRTSNPDSNALPFVVQKHAATRLHYDFRLGWRGVLKSWAVTKGPSFNSADKRLAVQVEDHPIEYGGFEGTIPKGQYGGGTVMLWDFGDWTPHGDVDEGLLKGHLKFELHGNKLKGSWALIRMHGQAERADKPHWLLIKENDSFTRPSSEPAIIDEAPESALTHRTMDEIAAGNDHSWGSATKSVSTASPAHFTRRPTADQAPPPKISPSFNSTHNSMFNSTPRAPMPHFVAPQLAQQTLRPPIGDDWIHELKLDGYRIQMNVISAKRGGRTVKLLTRKGLDWTHRMPDIARAAEKMQVDNAILDGEVVVLDKKGGTSFADLQAAFQQDAKHFLTYFIFDLLYLNGRDLRGLPFIQRKEFLVELLQPFGADSPLRLSEHLAAAGNQFFAQACAFGAEGIVSKLKMSKYVSGRSGAWLKIKCRQEQEFVIGGFTKPSKGGAGIGALLLGYYQSGELNYAGRTGTGFTAKTHGSLRAVLDPLTQVSCPFSNMPAEGRRDAIWVRPERVAQVAFATWTRENLLRQAAFKGLREDKPAREVGRESATAPPATERSFLGVKDEDATRPRGNSSRIRKNKKAADEVETINLQLTHSNKILDEASGMTKLDLARYYLDIADKMLPYIAHRPLSIVRCPEGSGKPCFFQKHAGIGLPEGVKTIAVPNRKSGTQEEFLTVDSAQGLLSMAQLGVLEIHTWGSKDRRLEKPDQIVFDLDPDTTIDWSTLASAAHELRKRLRAVDLESYLKSTGGKGLHLVVPIAPQHSWTVVRGFAHQVMLGMEKDEPSLYLTKMTKSARSHRIYLDYLRNDRGATSIAPFSPRARSGVPVALPLDWKELKSDRAPAFHVMDFAQWKSRLRRNPWRGLSVSKQRLTAAAIRALQPSSRPRSGRD